GGCRSGADTPARGPVALVCHTLPLGVTGNTPDSGSGESWFEPRRGNQYGITYGRPYVMSDPRFTAVDVGPCDLPIAHEPRERRVDDHDAPMRLLVRGQSGCDGHQRRRSSTRRFSARPASVAFVATGSLPPAPRDVSLIAAMP